MLRRRGQRVRRNRFFVKNRPIGQRFHTRRPGFVRKDSGERLPSERFPLCRKSRRFRKRFPLRLRRQTFVLRFPDPEGRGVREEKRSRRMVKMRRQTETRFETHSPFAKTGNRSYEKASRSRHNPKCPFVQLFGVQERLRRHVVVFRGHVLPELMRSWKTRPR